ncbi:MAG: FAD-dependent oxidoreductase [Roseiflexaceae bacterium]
MTLSPSSVTADIVILGGGLGGVAAALRLCAHDRSVVIVEPTPWLGGQATCQGVSALDEHRHIETFGGTPDYMNWRMRIRQRMAILYGISPHDWSSFNPGNAWVSNLCFLPKIAADVIDEMLAPYVASGRCHIMRNTTWRSIHRSGNRITQVVTQCPSGITTIHGNLFIDASELGDGLSLANLTYITGAESQCDTGEAKAPAVARPEEIQGFTYCFAVSYHDGESHIIAKPEGYEQLRDQQPFTLTLMSDAGEPRPFSVFATGTTGLPPFWTYRRLWDGGHTNPAGEDIAMINWNSNDYHHGTIIDVADEVVSARLDEAKRLSLAFLYWMQTEMPRDDGGFGYPGLKLMPEVMGTADGLSMTPYIREARRTPGLRRIVADDLLVEQQKNARAICYEDSIGIGWYFMDLHPAPGNPKSMFAPTRPFQIPLGALIPPDCTNLVMGNKNIATTHLSNGSYRLHPVEWNIGAVAGELCDAALKHQCNIADIWHQKAKLRAFQKRLIMQNHPIAWSIDVPFGHECFAVTQYLLANGILEDGSIRANQLTIELDQPLSDKEWQMLCQILASESLTIDTTLQYATWRDVCKSLNTMLFGSGAS